METIRISEEDIRIEKLKNYMLGLGTHTTLDNFTFIRLNRKNLIASIYADEMCSSTFIYEVSEDPRDVVRFITEIY